MKAAVSGDHADDPSQEPTAEGRSVPAAGGVESLPAMLRRRLAAETVDLVSSGTTALLEARDDERY